MANDRVFNFSAGPSMLPLEVLQRAGAEITNYNGSGMSVMEMSHRSKVFQKIFDDTQAKFRKLMNVPEGYKVLFLQGGGTMQFGMVPMNLIGKTGKADYAVTGNFANLAMKEAKKYGEINIAASTEDRKHTYIPAQGDLKLSADASYFYYCSNNTIEGTQWQYVPETNGVPLVSDMSSDILSRPVDVSKYGIIFAGAQKNLAPAGLTIAIVREDLAQRGLAPDAVHAYAGLGFTVSQSGSALNFSGSSASLVQLFCITAEQYEALSGQAVTLQPGQVLAYTNRCGLPDTFTLAGQTWQVIGPAENFTPSKYITYLAGIAGLVVPDKAALERLYQAQNEAYGGNASQYISCVAFNVPGMSEEDQSAYVTQLLDVLRSNRPDESVRVSAAIHIGTASPAYGWTAGPRAGATSTPCTAASSFWGCSWAFCFSQPWCSSSTTNR